MTFGYDSKIFSKSVSEIPNFAAKLLGELRTHRASNAEQVNHLFFFQEILEQVTDRFSIKRRPIIFICHSLGGIVCKQVTVLLYAYWASRSC